MRLYFDECCCRRLPRELKEFFAIDYPDLITAHVLDFYEAGAWDSRWLDPLKEDKSWIVITQDLGRNPNKEKLPVICRSLGITHIGFSPAIISSGYSVQKAALVTIWPQLVNLAKLPLGTHVRLSIVHGKGGIPRYELIVKGRPLSVVIGEIDFRGADKST
jgi:hypothetical protein